MKTPADDGLVAIHRRLDSQNAIAKTVRVRSRAKIACIGGRRTACPCPNGHPPALGSGLCRAAIGRKRGRCASTTPHHLARKPSPTILA
jgi:hypothetical protein